ncbi:MAG: carbohydrate kinase family protein [Bacilli bacterium]|nr:carbohydrate kinase family protein [Bacilli bacterium]
MKIVCVGSTVFDMTYVVEDSLKEDSKTRSKDYVECGGGNGANYAYSLAFWGNNVELYSLIGYDLYGKLLLDEFDMVGINKSGIEIRKGFPTPKSVIISNLSNSTRTIVTTTREIVRKLNAEICNDADILLLDGTYIETARELINSNKKATIVFDIEKNDPEIIELAKSSNYIICSKDFAESFTNMDLSNKDNIESCYDVISDSFPNSKVIITLGKDGSITKEEDYLITDTIDANTVDTTGSGDIFHAAFVHFLVNGYNLKDSIKYSTVAAGLSTEKVGCRNKIPTLEEVLNYDDVI